MLAPGGENNEPNETLKEAIGQIGKSRVILARCDSPTSIRVGQSLGLTMFQGRHVDTILSAGSRRGRSPMPRPARR